MSRTDPILLPRRGLLAAALGVCLPALAAEPGYEWRPWPAGKAVPPLALNLLDGTPWQVAQDQGKVVLVNFWATWCEPCRAEMPSLARLAQRHAPDELRLLTANYRESPAAIRRFLDTLGLQLPVLRDVQGTAARAWTPGVLPSTVIFDRRGRPAGVLVGEIDWTGAQAEALLAPLLASPSRST